MTKRTPIIFEYTTIKSIIQSIQSPTDKILCLVTYANGARVMETCALQYLDFEWSYEFLYIHSPILKKRKTVIPKRRNPISRTQEPWLTEPIIAYVQSNRLSPVDTRNIWTYSKRTAQRRFDEYFGTISHAMRHNRASHLRVIFKWTVEDLGAFFGLSPSGIFHWADIYGHLGTSYLEDKWRKID